MGPRPSACRRDWNLPWLKGFQARLRNAYVDDGGNPTVQAFRIALDYAIPLF
jgi:hypothetical protein